MSQLLIGKESAFYVKGSQIDPAPSTIFYYFMNSYYSLQLQHLLSATFETRICRCKRRVAFYFFAYGPSTFI